MFNRLPIYTRPKDSAIGNPVLIGSSNERLSGRVVSSSSASSSDARPRTTPHNSNKNPDFGKGLPPIPTSSFSEFQALPRDRSYSQGTSHRDQAAASSLDARSTRRQNVIRKPAPSPVGTDTWEQTGTATGAGFTDEWDAAPNPNTLSFSSSGASVGGGGGSVKSTGSGFTLGNLVKEKMTGRRNKIPNYGLPEPPDLPGLENEGVPTIKPVGLNSIDDWLDSREGLHKRSTCSSSSSTQNITGKYSDSRELHIRQSTFAPLQPPEFTSEASSVPSIPPRFMAKSTFTLPPRQSSLHQQDAVPRSSRHRVNRPPSPQLALEKKPQDTQAPRDHISQLEYEQEQLEDRKKSLRKKIYDLEELNQEYADAEKSAHDLGLKLYRAYRRKDKRDGLEGPTHLWVSRVTAPLDD
ncbi:hypothetical protein BDD12DRAFT_876254 [Trichophaea hybrida]|nr:hypothetical protein BDD12DRAFT_876254 [Trichophaea hybrida]